MDKGEAIKILKDFHDESALFSVRTALETLYPEFKESEGKSGWQINSKYNKPQKNHSVLMQTTHGIAEGEWQGEQWHQYRWAGLVRDTDVLSWMELSDLEKQGEQKVSYTTTVETGDGGINALVTRELSTNDYDEQKAADKVEPKFKVGDWITNGDYTWKIVEIKPLDYILQSQDGNIVDDTIYHVDNQFNFWTIQDAKDGDVLVNGSNIFIFHFINDTRLMGYCHVNTDDGRFYEDIGKNECFCLIDAIVNPATKEQCDLLFQKMYEAGYEWDDEKKELKKIDARENLTLDGDLMEADCMIVEQKPIEWDADDDDKFFFLKARLKDYEDCIIYDEELSECQKNDVRETTKEFLKWLDSIKERMGG